MIGQQSDASLEKLNRGIEESRREAQLRAMGLAREYFDGSVRELGQQVDGYRAVLNDLPDRAPGGREEPFRMLSQELADNYPRIQECLGAAQRNVADLDTERLAGRVEGSEEEGPEASDAAKREAERLGVDLSQVEGTGSDGRIVFWDITEQADTAKEDTGSSGQATGRAGDAADQAEQSDGMQERTEEPKATNAARRKAEKLGVDLSQFEGSGPGGLTTINDVTDAANR